MTKHRVLLLSAHPLLSEGLANMLGKMEDMILIGPHAVSDFVLSNLSAFAPDVVLFAEQETNDTTANALLFEILRESPDLPVIQVGLSGDNTLRIYTSHALPARSADLIETIRNLPFQRPGD
jgi:chemotaxis response regulator CheB